jgi:hypothetical protein
LLCLGQLVFAALIELVDFNAGATAIEVDWCYSSLFEEIIE